MTDLYTDHAAFVKDWPSDRHKMPLHVTFADGRPALDIVVEGRDITVAHMDFVVRAQLQALARGIPASWQAHGGVGKHFVLRAGIVWYLLRDRDSLLFRQRHGAYAILYGPDHGDSDGLQTQFDIVNEAVSLQYFDLLTASISTKALISAVEELRSGSVGDEVDTPLAWSKLMLAEAKVREREADYKRLLKLAKGMHL
jgi:hypothetical protein